MAHQAFERCCEGLRNESGTGDSEAAWHAIGLNQKNRANATSSSPSHNVPWTFGGGDRVSPVCAITQPGRPAELLLLDRHRRGQFRALFHCEEECDRHSCGLTSTGPSMSSVCLAYTGQSMRRAPTGRAT